MLKKYDEFFGLESKLRQWGLLVENVVETREGYEPARSETFGAVYANWLGLTHNVLKRKSLRL